MNFLEIHYDSGFTIVLVERLELTNFVCGQMYCNVEQALVNILPIVDSVVRTLATWQ